MARTILTSIDGAIGPPESASISVLDDGLLRGDGAFEMIKLYGGHAFRLDAHLARLGRSAAAIELGYDQAALASEIEALLTATGDDDAALRIVLTRGGRRILLIEAVTAWPPSASVALVVVTPSEILAGVKSISYAANMQAGRIAAARGADEAVYVHPDGTVLEAPTSSVFWVGADGALRTPALDTGILDSLTREVVLEAMEVEEGRFDAADLSSAREAYLASTLREIQPISAINAAELPEVGGDAAKAAATALAGAVAAEQG